MTPARSRGDEGRLRPPLRGLPRRGPAGRHPADRGLARRAARGGGATCCRAEPVVAPLRGSSRPCASSRGPTSPGSGGRSRRAAGGRTYSRHGAISRRRASPDQEPVRVGLDDPFLLPAAHDADRGFDRRADEVRDVLPGEGKGTNAPSAPFLSESRSASVENRRAARYSTEPVMSARRRFRAISRSVRPGEQAARDLGPLLDELERSRARESRRCREGSSATAVAGNGRCSNTATAPTGSPGPRISRIRSRSGVALTILTRPTKKKVDAEGRVPSSKRVAPLS